MPLRSWTGRAPLVGVVAALLPALRFVWGVPLTAFGRWRGGGGGGVHHRRSH